MKVSRLLLAPALLLGGRSALAGGDPPAGSAAARWGADYFPNVALVTHEGKTVRFFDDLIRDKVVVISFIYTSCPDACPLETAKLTEVHGLLGDRVGQDVFFYSISIDPENDTPEVLRAYAERFQVGAGWQFLTGAKEDIRLLRQKLGMLRSGEERLVDHSLSLLIGNQATGQWMKRSPMENPYLLATQIGDWLHNWKLAPAPGRAYADAPKLRSVARGENLYRTRCMTCHGIGATDGIVRQGPDLLGVTERRERGWLSRWLAEPDVMLAEKDPLALELFAANRNLPMPNMRLAPSEVEALLDFMHGESRRIQDERAAALAAAARAEAEASEAEGSGVGEDGAEETVPPCCQKKDGLVLDSEEPDEGEAPSANLAPGPLFDPPAPRAASAPPKLERPAAHVPRGPILLCLGLALAIGGLGAACGRRGA
ncbi:MAG: c-type cytochrome [Planctomycetes bacterium]|nr:c-type cytochrome [Planctomycetota bacterium]